MNHNGNHIEARLWEAADELRANSKLKSSEYTVPGLCKVATLSEIEARELEARIAENVVRLLETQ